MPAGRTKKIFTVNEKSSLSYYTICEAYLELLKCGFRYVDHVPKF